MTRSGMTLVEIMVSIAIFLTLMMITAFVHSNIGKAINRSLAMLQLHHEAAAITQRLREDLENCQPHVAMNLTDNHLTFMRTHGEALAQERSHQGLASGNYAHDLAWVRWWWYKGQLRRAISPRLRQGSGVHGANNVDHEGSLGGSSATGMAPSPQQYYEFFEPSSVPDPLASSTYESDVGAFKASLAEAGHRMLDTDIYYRPAKLWWHPGFGDSWNRGVPGTPMKVYVGPTTTETGSSPISNIAYKSMEFETESDPLEVAFSVVNQSGYSVNRDYINLVGTHPEQAFSSNFPSRLALVSDQVMDIEIHLFGNSYTPDGVVAKNGTEKSILMNGSDADLGTGSFAGIPTNPSSKNIIGKHGPGTSGLMPYPFIVRSRPYNERPVRAEIKILLTTIPPTALDLYDADGDGDDQERLAVAIAEQHPGDHDAMIDAVREEGYVAAAFTMAVNLP